MYYSWMRYDGLIVKPSAIFVSMTSTAASPWRVNYIPPECLMKILLVIFTDPLSIFYAQENNNLFVQYYFKKDANVLKT